MNEQENNLENEELVEEVEVLNTNLVVGDDSDGRGSNRSG